MKRFYRFIADVSLLCRYFRDKLTKNRGLLAINYKKG